MSNRFKLWLFYRFTDFTRFSKGRLRYPLAEGFDQPTVDAGRIVVDLIVIELLGRGGRTGMGQNKGAAGRQTGGGHLDDLCAVDFTDAALDDGLLTGIAVLDEGRILLEQVGKAIGAEGDAAAFGDIVFAHILLTFQEALVSVGLGDGLVGKTAVEGGRMGQRAQNIAVKLGDPDLVGLTAEGAACVGDHLRLDLVATVDDKGKGAVTLDGHGLDVALEIVGRTVTAGARSGVVPHGDNGDGVDIDGVYAGKCIVVVEGSHNEGFPRKALINLRTVLGCKILSCHVIIPFLMCVVEN